MSSPVSYDLQGQGGGKVLVGGEEALNVRWLQVIADSEINAISSSNLENASDLSGVTIPAGIGIGGRIESVSLTSGLAIAYYI